MIDILDELLRASAEIQRLNKCLQWEQHRSGRIGTHGISCYKWGPTHYECALRRIDELEKICQEKLTLPGNDSET